MPDICPCTGFAWQDLAWDYPGVAVQMNAIYYISMNYYYAHVYKESHITTWNINIAEQQSGHTLHHTHTHCTLGGVLHSIIAEYCTSGRQPVHMTGRQCTTHSYFVSRYQGFKAVPYRHAVPYLLLWLLPYQRTIPAGSFKRGAGKKCHSRGVQERSVSRWRERMYEDVLT